MSAHTGAAVASATPGPLTLEEAKKLFSFRGKSIIGEGVDIQLVRTHYHPQVHFKDAIQELHGKEAVIEMLQRFPQRCDDLRCEVNMAIQHENVLVIEWFMTMRVSPLPEMTNHGVTKLTLDEHGMVIDHRDFFDLWGDMIDAFPRAARLYRRAVKHLE